MVDVVDYGTGTAAALPGIKVAGKTGTAELENRGPDAEAGSGSQQHRRLVHRLRAGGAAAHRSGRRVRARGRRRLDGRPGGEAGHGRRALEAQGCPQRLDIQLEDELLFGIRSRGRRLDLELERPVVGVGDRQLEEQHRSGRRPELSDRPGLRLALVGVELGRVVGEVVVLGQLGRLELVALVVDDLEAAGRGQRLGRVVAGLEEDPVERLALLGQRALVVGVVGRDLRVQLPRDEDVVLDAREVEGEPSRAGSSSVPCSSLLQPAKSAAASSAQARTVLAGEAMAAGMLPVLRCPPDQRSGCASARRALRARAAAAAPGPCRSGRRMGRLERLVAA